MNFQQPEALYLILPLTIAVLALALYARANRRRAARAFADAAMSPRVLPPESGSRFWCKLALWEAALIFTLLAIARPQWGEIVEEVKIKGSDLYIMIDVSRSMLATDVPPSRLERAKADVSSLLSRLKGERVGLIAFAGRAAILSPLTADYAFFRARLTELGPNSVDRGGTAIGDAIRKALSVLPEAPDRDQALLLITDGDDQESEPLKAAALAAERHIAIFTVGLGDPNEGALVPDKEGKGGFMTYEGKNVVSKMDDELLGKIALQTGGTYIPARTKAYDLGKLYEEKLSQLRGEYAKEQKRTRQAERFEIPLALALICFTLELLIRPYRQKMEENMNRDSTNRDRKGAAALAKDADKAGATKPIVAALALMLAFAGFNAHAADARDLVNEGLKLYSKQDFDGAGEKFSEAEKAAPQQDVLEAAARAAFDAGCAYAQKGDTEKADDAYKKAALARDRMLAASAHFNLGEISANAAKTLAGAQPEAVPPDKRKEVIDKLLEAVGHYRNCLEIQPEYASARKNIELIRQWIKLYSNVWAQLDRKKRRDEMNLLQFLEFLAHDERQLRAGAQALGEYASADAFAELKRVQDELSEEIKPLKEKIEKDAISTSQLMGGPAPAPNSEEEKKKAEAVKKLKELADTAGEKMRSASGSLNSNRGDEAAALQKEAAMTFDTIWESLAPFQAALGRDMKDETQIVDALKESESAKDDAAKNGGAAKKNELAKTSAEQAKESAPISTQDLTELQSDAARRTMLMKFRAAAEMAELEKNAPKTDEKSKEKEKELWTLDDVKREEAKKKAEEEKKKRDEELKKNGQQPAEKKDEKEDDKPPTPEEIKKGLEKAIELAPKAVERMNAAAERLKKEERASALPDAEEAKKILQEIMDAQPKQKKKDQKQDEKKDQQNQQNQDKNEQQKKDEEKKKQDQQKKDEEKKKEDEKKKDEEKKKDDEKKDEKKDQKKDEPNKDKQEQGAAKPQPMTKEQAEAMLRKVRERELDHRKKKLDEQDAIMGRLRGVEKDW